MATAIDAKAAQREEAMRRLKVIETTTNWRLPETNKHGLEKCD